MKKLLSAIIAGALITLLPGCRDNNCYEPCDKPCKKECPPPCQKPCERSCPKPCEKACPKKVCQKSCEKCPTSCEKKLCQGGSCPISDTYETKKTHKADRTATKKTKRTSKATGNGMSEDMPSMTMEMHKKMMQAETPSLPTMQETPSADAK